MSHPRTLLLGLTLLLVSTLHAQKLNDAYLRYIETYKETAIDQMKRWRIPASITLAQGLLESRAGQSDLTRRSNNHFGIKCGGDWTGPSVRQDDDYANECFRVYKHAYESYEDHSKFLALRKRYASLFQLDIKDYKSWARGLKSCGYATSPTYAQNLIHIIELYGLSSLDRGGNNKKGIYIIPGQEHQVFKYNHNYYIVARDGDTFEQISAETGVSVRKLIKYNELYDTYKLKGGDIIYMERKCRSAERRFRKHPHVVQAGESMYSIAQKYGIRLASLYKKNKLSQAYQPQVGDQLKVR